MYTCHPTYTGAGAVANAVIFYSNIFTILISSIFIGLIKFFSVKTEPALAMALLDVIVIIIQISLYWYLENLVGRLIVWIKHLRKKSTPQPEK